MYVCKLLIEDVLFCFEIRSANISSTCCMQNINLKLLPVMSEVKNIHILILVLSHTKYTSNMNVRKLTTTSLELMTTSKFGITFKK